MRTLAVVIVVCLLLAVGAIFFVMDGGARGEVAIDSGIDKIDGFLGKLSISRKKIEKGMEHVDDSIDAMGRARIETSVRLESLDSKIQSLEQAVKQIDQELAGLRSKLTGPMPVKIGANKYSAQDLKKSASRLMVLRESKVIAIADYKSAQSVMKKATEGLSQKQSSARQRIVRLESTLTAIDAKTLALNSLRSTYVVGGNSSFIDQLNELDEMIEDLLVDVETELRWEEEKWDEEAAMDGISSLDALLLEDIKEPADIVAEINAIIGASPAVE